MEDIHNKIGKFSSLGVGVACGWSRGYSRQANKCVMNQVHNPATYSWAVERVNL
jgi:hypothetical protein